jgi:multidrug efflux pump subunit AcrB
MKKTFGRLQRLSLWSFKRPRRTALIWLVLVVFGAACYGTLLKREGFPSVNTPFAIASGSYLVNDPGKVDHDIAGPVSSFLLKQPDVKTVQTQSANNFYSIVVSYKDKIDAGPVSKDLSRKINQLTLLPPQATMQFAPYEFGFTQRGDDVVVAFYSPDNSTDNKVLTAQAQKAATFIRNKHLPLVKRVAIFDQYEMATNPLTGLKEYNQKSFGRFGQRADGQNRFYKSIVIGIKAKPDADNLELDKQVRSAVSELNGQPQFRGYKATVSASYAPQINEQIDTLQRALLEGLAAVLIVGSIVIAVRASIITVLSMITVLATTSGLLYLIGYSLNTITLFALILALSLIVDDTIIMVEALDAQRRRQTDAAKAVGEATGRVSRAMIAATSTAVLSFAPLLFVSGILGGFIRAIPVTIISALAISLLVALIFIPFFARFLMLRPKQMGARRVHEISNGVEAAVARFVSGPMLWAKGSSRKLIGVGLIAFIIGLGFIGAGGYLFQKVTFNIFPAAKDGDQMTVTITYNHDTDIGKAQAIADRVDRMTTETLGRNFVKGSYYDQTGNQTATLTIDLTSYQDRDVTAPQLVDRLDHKFSHFKAATVEAAQLGVGPPAAEFTVQIESGQNRPAALHLADDVAGYLRNDAVLKRPDGSIAKISKVTLGNSSIYTRDDNKQYVAVDIKYADTDTSTLVELTKSAVKKEFPTSKVNSYGLPKSAISFNAGQEDDNQNSFKSLAYAFPVLLVVVYFVLAIEFRSLLQPALIFMAIPFSLFGITLGLYLTDNAFSFFAMLGFFALIGLSIKNTILLTDYANQSRRAGRGPVDAAHEALAERFRPLIATSLTAVFSLIPLALSSPFWEGLAVVLIFGLLSSTFLVITVFPYYYLGSEFLRRRYSRRIGIAWILLSIAWVLILSAVAPKLAILSPVLAALLLWIIGKRSRNHSANS